MQALVDTINAMYDLNMTLDDVTELGKDILRKERAFNAAAGFTKAHDRLPSAVSRLPPTMCVGMFRTKIWIPYSIFNNYAR